MNARINDTGGYIIDQTGNTTTASDKMIKVGSGVWSRIKQIHDNTNLYVGELVNGVLQVKQLSDSNKAIYADGTALVLGSNQDVFMKLPHFWWKATPDENDDDICEVNFSMDEPEDSSTWNEWEGNTFMGAYKGMVIDGGLYSRSGEIVGNYTRSTMNNYRTYARNRGAGYTCITYEMWHIFVLLGFGWLKTLSARSVYSVGSANSTTRATGTCDSLGMADGIVGNYSSFWGVEDFITATGLGEFVDNLTRDSSNLISILDTSTLTATRTVQAGATLNGNRWITKIVLGQYADILPKDTVTSRLDDNVKYVCYCNIFNTGFLISNASNSSNTGFIGIQATGSQAAAVSYTTSRLQYKGNYIIID